MSSKAALLKAAAIRIGTVDVDGVTYRVREFSAGAFADYAKHINEDRARAIAGALRNCVVDEEGADMLTDEEAQLVAQSSRVSLLLLHKIVEMSGLKESEDAEEKKADAS